MFRTKDVVLSQGLALVDKVPVVDLNGRALTPCSPEKAEQNIRDGLATLDAQGVLHLHYRPLAHRRIYRQVHRRDGWICAWCGQAGSTLDHVIPICWGGATRLDNCVIACRACNHSRNNALPSTFLEWTGYHPTHPVIRAIVDHEAQRLIEAEQALANRPLSSCCTREEAQVWVAYHAETGHWVPPQPPTTPLTYIKPDLHPFLDYFVP
jgi:hypothetical protein